MDNKLHVLKSEEVVQKAGEVVGRPKFNWKIRILLPGLVFGGFLVLLGLSVYSELVPAVTVHASPVISKKVAGSVAGAVTVQAAGWVEADPYKSYVTALTDGVIQEVLVFEGDVVQKGQVVATLVDEDAQLAAQRSMDKVKELEATLASQQAEFEAAKTERENPTERRRACDTRDRCQTRPQHDAYKCPKYIRESGYAIEDCGGRKPFSS